MASRVFLAMALLAAQAAAAAEPALGTLFFSAEELACAAASLSSRPLPLPGPDPPSRAS